MQYPKMLGALLACTMFISPLRAQRMLGVSTDDYNAYYSLFMNPANIADIHETFVLNLGSVNIGVDNTFGPLGNIGNITKSFSGNDSIAASAIFENAGHKTFNMLVPVADIKGPGFVAAINYNHSIALTTRIRGFNQFTNFDQSLYNTVTTANYISPTTYNVSTQNFNWTAHMWSEIGVSYGGVIINDDRVLLKVGATVRRLGGIGFIGLKGKNLDITYYGGADSFYAANSDMHFASNVLSDSSAVLKGLTASNMFTKFFGGDAGNGFGGDLGVSFRYYFGNPDPIDYVESNVTHDIVLSASVTDIGYIDYKNTNNIDVAGSGYLTGKGITDNVKTNTKFKNYMKGQGFDLDMAPSTTRVYMPTALVLSADYQVYEKFWVNAVYIKNLANRANYGNSYYNSITIAPRYNAKHINLVLPISYSTLAKDLKVGFAVRATGIFIGSDDMLALFSKSQYGFNCYAGVFIPAYKKKSKT